MTNTDIADNLRSGTETKIEGAIGVVPWNDISGLWYFAHIYTATDKRAEEANFRLCCIRTAKLISIGYFVYSPICHTHPIHIAWPEFLTNNERDLWINLDNLVIDNTNFRGLILAPKWEQSKGCCGERAKFIEQGKTIKLYTDIMKAEIGKE